jgi:hypothetical protein
MLRQRRPRLDENQLHGILGRPIGAGRKMCDHDWPGRCPALAPWQRTLCRMADEISAEAKVSPQSVAELVAHYGSANMASRAIMVMS